jgi:protein tyrosine/serine phosphatase
MEMLKYYCMWEYVLGGASLFGLIVGLFSIYNGRATRKLLMEEERLTREMIEKLVGKIDEGFRRMDEGFRRMDEGFRRMDERFAKMDERFAKMDERFIEVLREIRQLRSG